MKRRNFLSAAGASLAVASLEGLALEKSSRPLRLLILGGTRFIGLHMTELALARGHSLTFFNRGRTNTDRFPEVERLRGDRNGNLKSLAGREWDAVIDNSGYVPRQVRDAASLLEPKVARYVFISTISVYETFARANDESSSVGKLADETVETVDGATYGPLKALCETAAYSVFGERRTSIIRPGLIVGPDDNTDRFTYWPARAARGGRMIAPNDPRDPIQLIDARDLAAFTLRLIEDGTGGTFNALSPPGRFTIGEVVNESISAATALARPSVAPQAEWVDTKTLDEQKITPWADMPVWAPSEGDNAGFASTSADRALKAGLSIRSMRETVRDTLAWHLARPESERAKMKAGLTPERESAALAAIAPVKSGQRG
jgi:2'-hydroxyisoflavone reductase